MTLHQALLEIDERRRPWRVDVPEDALAADLNTQPYCDSLSIEVGMRCRKTEGHKGKHANVSPVSEEGKTVTVRYEWA